MTREPATDAPRSLADPSPFDRHYGLEILSYDHAEVRGRVTVCGHHLQPTGVVHGGVYASIAEAVASLGTNWHVHDDGLVALGLLNSTQFLRPVAGGSIEASGRPRHRGRDTWVWDVELRDADGRVCAASRVTVAVRAATAPC